MPTYEYYCPSNGQVQEVFHGMSQKLVTWGELCQLADIPLGDTPADEPIQRNILGGQLMLKREGSFQRDTKAALDRSLKQNSSPSHAHSACCGGGSCKH